jgi:hypothetical protein
MQVLAYLLLGSIVAEAIVYIMETLYEQGYVGTTTSVSRAAGYVYAKIHGHESNMARVSDWKVSGTLLQLFTDITLFGPIAFSIVYANDVTACPSYDSGASAFEFLHIAFVCLYGFYLLHVFLSFSGFSFANDLFVRELRHLGKQMYVVM